MDYFNNFLLYLCLKKFEGGFKVIKRSCIGGVQCEQNQIVFGDNKDITL